MESLSTIERLRQVLESEEASETLTVLPADAYIKLANYAQKLRATTGSGNEDAPGRLAKKQLWLMEVMTRRLLQLRLAKGEKEEEAAATHEVDQPQRSSNNLLPEERYINDVFRQLTKKEERFVKAVADGQPSFFTLVQRRETQRMTTVRISKRVGEIIGADLKRYGPFEVNDVARLPMGNAQVMVASRQAVPISTDDY
jgi:DNA replication initiation complex subunit (GINS family)